MQALALRVLEGPDLGACFAVPLRGGAIGRDDACVVRLSDPTVSRRHAWIEWSDGACVLCDDSGRPRTLVNGQPVSRQPLRPGDRVVLGASTLAVELRVAAAPALTPTPTIEVTSRQLHQLRVGSTAPYHHDVLVALAELGERLAAGTALGPDEVGPIGGRAAARALHAEAVAMCAPGRAVHPTWQDGGAHPTAAIVDHVVTAGVAHATSDGTRQVLCAPLIGWTGTDTRVIAALWLERPHRPWTADDVVAGVCFANLIAAAQVAATAYDRVQRERQALARRVDEQGLIGSAPATVALRAQIAKLAPTSVTVCLGGESGSGKEMVARTIHHASPRAGHPFVAVNCAALPEALLEAQLFGHERGAFTGASEARPGLFEVAHGGSLFLDEIGELPLPAQAKFLRVLEERAVTRVGAHQPREVDVRIIAATHRDLAEEVRRGHFREDLFYRLSVIQLVVPPLRDRPDDIGDLAEHFLAQARLQTHRRLRGLSPAARAALRQYGWPGNVRELRNVIERACVLGESAWLEASDLPAEVLAASTPVPPEPTGTGPVTANSVPTMAAASGARPLRDWERDAIIAAMAATGGNKAQAAALLEIDRSTLYKKLRDYQL